jgi:hypothetical protein
VAGHATGQDREMGVRCSRHTRTVRLNDRNTPLRCDAAPMGRRMASLGPQKTGFGAGTWVQTGVHAQVGSLSPDRTPDLQRHGLRVTCVTIEQSCNRRGRAIARS